ncbi:MAG: hypothetical protein AAFQ92_00505 [Bacteroidota bacterium]
MLIAPCFMLMAYWYRKQMTQPLMVWKNPEMVIVTITFSVIALIFFIVGTSCLFTYIDVLDSSQLKIMNKEKFMKLGIICGLLLVGLVFTYLAIRMLLVRIVTEKGIVMNDRVFRVPDFRNVLEWHEISDYYHFSDYPNAIFTLIIQTQPLKYERISIRVPVYIRDDFEDLLETKMYTASAMKARADISSHNFSGN